jgi:hypothetical protein
MPALTRNKKKAATKSITPPTKQLTKSKTPPMKPQTSMLKKGAKSQNKPPLKKQKKEVVEEEPLEDYEVTDDSDEDDEVSDGSDEDDISPAVESEEIDESDDGENGSNQLFSDDEEENDEETLGDDFLEGSGDEDEEGSLDADSDADSDDDDIVAKSDAIDRDLAMQKKDAAAELEDFIKQDDVHDEEPEHDAFRLPTEEVTFFSCVILTLFDFGFSIYLTVVVIFHLSRSLKKKLVVHQIFLYLRLELKRLLELLKILRLSGQKTPRGKLVLNSSKLISVLIMVITVFLLELWLRCFLLVNLWNLLKLLKSKGLRPSELTHLR